MRNIRVARVAHDALMDSFMKKLVLTTDETAEWLRTTPEVVHRLAAEGRLAAVNLVEGEPPVFRPEDVVAFVENASGSETPTGEFVRKNKRVFAAPLPEEVGGEGRAPRALPREAMQAFRIGDDQLRAELDELRSEVARLRGERRGAE